MFLYCTFYVCKFLWDKQFYVKFCWGKVRCFRDSFVYWRALFRDVLCLFSFASCWWGGCIECCGFVTVTVVLVVVVVVVGVVVFVVDFVVGVVVGLIVVFVVVVFVVIAVAVACYVFIMRWCYRIVYRCYTN